MVNGLTSSTLFKCKAIDPFAFDAAFHVLLKEHSVRWANLDQGGLVLFQRLELSPPLLTSGPLPVLLLLKVETPRLSMRGLNCLQTLDIIAVLALPLACCSYSVQLSEMNNCCIAGC